MRAGLDPADNQIRCAHACGISRLLEAGGYAHVYRQTPLAADEMAHIRSVLQFILDRHTPYAAVVLDRYSNSLMGNEASKRLIAALVDSSLLAERMNFLRVLFHPSACDVGSSTGMKSRERCSDVQSGNWRNPKTTR